MLCAGLDEAVLSTPWGAESEWAQHPLLVTLHREAWGGEKFFEMLDRISADPARYLDLMELQYLVPRVRIRRASTRSGSAGTIASRRSGGSSTARSAAFAGVPDPELSLRWRGLQDRRNPLIRYVPWWVVGAAALAILAATFAAYRATPRATLAAPVHAALAKVGLEDFSPRRGARRRLAGPTLKQLLAPEEARGTLSA